MALGGIFRNPKKDSDTLRGRQQIQQRDQTRADEQRRMDTFKGIAQKGTMAPGGKKKPGTWRPF